MVNKSCEDEQLRDDSEPLWFFWWTFLIESTIKTGDVQTVAVERTSTRLTFETFEAVGLVGICSGSSSA